MQRKYKMFTILQLEHFMPLEIFRHFPYSHLTTGIACLLFKIIITLKAGTNHTCDPVQSDNLQILRLQEKNALDFLSVQYKICVSSLMAESLLVRNFSFSFSFLNPKSPPAPLIGFLSPSVCPALWICSTNTRVQHNRCPQTPH